MTAVSCHCEVPKARHHVRQYSFALSCHCEGAERPWQSQGSEAETCNRKTVAIAKSLELNGITTSCATPRNDMCHPEATAEGSQEVNEILKHLTASPTDAGSHNSFLVGSLCKVQDDKYVSKAHSKHLFPYSPINLLTFKKAAFTLAEVLITLGIIGIVAAMTIPTLIADYQEKQTVTKLTKAYATLNNAYQMAKVENGELASWGFTGNSSFEVEEDDDETHITYTNSADDNAKLLWDKLSPHLKINKRIDSDLNNASAGKPNYVRKTLSGKELADPGIISEIILADGTSFISGWISNYKCTSQTQCGDIGIDINGLDNPPNTYGKDIFFFRILGKGIFPIGGAGEKELTRTFETSCDRNDGDSANGYGCSAWVIYNKNMDYLHCDDLSWTGKHKCDE